jgi:hypothetical protein
MVISFFSKNQPEPKLSSLFEPVNSSGRDYPGGYFILAVRFGLVHSSVRLCDELFQINGIEGTAEFAGSYSYADSYVKVSIHISQHSAVDAGSQVFQGLFGLKLVGIKHDYQKLLTAIADDKVTFTEESLQVIGHILEDIVSRQVPVGVIHRLEVVNINQDKT